MTWDAYHRREDVLGRVMRLADRRRDGVIPWAETAGADAAFGNPTDLLRALHMRWHTRLSGAFERELHEQPWDLEQVVVHAWRQTAAEMPGVRAILDAHGDDEAMHPARRKDWILLATASGAAGIDDPRAPEIGRAVEDRAREVVVDKTPPVRDTWIARLKHVLAA
ncbi:MAG: hypothetical protein GEU93_17485 [Propionibacteriales bacterium]|nr:hypothetical protein [Propionibacteriales bacterium]